MTIKEVLKLREQLWDRHPIVTESAILPTLPLQDVVARVLALSRKSRSSIAFWADPLTGKSSCVLALENELHARIPGCGVVIFEAVEDRQTAEGRLLVQILRATGYALPVERDLASKRHQVTRALLALSGSARHLFLLIDEAQELGNPEFAWLKAVINSLTLLGVKVTTVLFGQRELEARRDELMAKGRSDLGIRFMKVLLGFSGCRNRSDLAVILQALDTRSEFPENSGLCYTRFLLPKAHDGGFRAVLLADALWGAIEAAVPHAKRVHGAGMDIVAALLAQYFIHYRNADGAHFTIDTDAVADLAKKALYV